MTKANKGKLASIYVLCFFIMFFLTTVLSYGQSQTSENQNRPIEINDGVKYRWGDSWVNTDGIPVWVYEEMNDLEWKNARIPGEPSRTGYSKNIWYKFRIPEGDWNKPAVLFCTYEQSFEVYLGDKLIYSHGQFNSNSNKVSLGSIWSIIPLPDDFEGKIISFRMYSPSPIYAGNIKKIHIGSENDFLNAKDKNLLNLVKQDIDYIVLSGLFILIGFYLIITSILIRFDHVACFSLSFSSILIGIWYFAESNVNLVFLDAPIIWVYIAYAAIHVGPTGFCIFVGHIFGGNGKKALYGISYLYYIYAVIAFALDISGLVSLADSIKLLHCLMAVSMGLILIVIITNFKTNPQNSKVLGVAFALFFVTCLYDILDRFYIPIAIFRGHHISQWGMFFFIISLLFILQRHFIDIKDKLNRYTEEIQNKNLAIDVNMKLLDEAIEYDRLKNEFLANISHEFRTPLSIILGTIQLFKSHIKNNFSSLSVEKTTYYIKSMQQNCYRLLRLVNNLIDISKIDSGFLEANMINCNIVSIIEEITLSVADYIKSKGITFYFDTDIEEKIIACDPDKIEKIILNLLSNAVKFTRSGDQISVAICDGGDNISIIVSDTGIGIQEDKLNIIFERFRQVDKSLTRNHEGSGIGLSLVKSLVEMHGGGISVHSEYGKGSEFTIKLPVIILPSSENCDDIGVKTKNSCVEKIDIEFSDIYS